MLKQVRSRSPLHLVGDARSHCDTQLREVGEAAVELHAGDFFIRSFLSANVLNADTSVTHGGQTRDAVHARTIVKGTSDDTGTNASGAIRALQGTLETSAAVRMQQCCARSGSALKTCCSQQKSAGTPKRKNPPDGGFLRWFQRFCKPSLSPCMAPRPGLEPGTQ